MTRLRRSHSGRRFASSQEDPVFRTGVESPHFKVLEFDGACIGNVGVDHQDYAKSLAACAFIVKASGGQVIHRESVFLGNGTNNVAELSGLLLGLRYCQKLGYTPLRIVGDSSNVFRYLTGRSKVPHIPHLARLLYQVHCSLATRSDPWDAYTRTNVAHPRRLVLLTSDPLRVVAMEVRLVPRSKNREADRLAEECLTESSGLLASSDIGASIQL